MLKLLDMEKFCSKLSPVTTSEYFIGRSNSFHPDGLFSESIFNAMDTPQRRKTYSYIDLNCKIIHPSLFPIFRRLDQKIANIIKSKAKYILDKDGNLIEDIDGDIYSINHIIKLFDKINFRSNDQVIRKDYIDMIKYYHKKNMIFIDKLVVIPPSFRDVVFGEKGDTTIHPINDYYIRIIRHSQQLELIKNSSVYDTLCNRMCDLVLELYEYMTIKISKKEGLLRSDMLGKRLDFTARAVISGAAAEVKPTQIGVPFKLLVKLFEPFLLFEILNSGRTSKEKLVVELEKYNGSKLNALSLKRLFIGIYKGDILPESLTDVLGEVVDRAIIGKVVIAKRDPALHAESMQAFEPVRISGNTIKLHPLKCASFNADFDGDQMALYVPITKQAINQAKSKMIVTESKDGMGQIIDAFEKDMAVGIYLLTMDPIRIPVPKTAPKLLKLEGVDTTNPHTWYEFAGNVTTLGRIIFNAIIPQKYRFINTALGKKEIASLAVKIYNSEGGVVYNEFADKCMKLAFKYSTILSPSFSFGDLDIPKDITNKKNGLSKMSSQDAQKVIDTVEKELKSFVESNMTNLGVLGKAGALKGGYGQSRQILVSKGLIADPKGKVRDPIENSYAEGLQSKDFFMSSSGTRRGIADRVLNTADTGYLSRKLVYALQRLEADPRIWNCKTKRPYVIRVTDDIVKRIQGRYLLNKDGEPILISDPSKYLGKLIPLKSPLYCRTTKLCRTCYGELLLRNAAYNVGIQAGQIFGERGTQMIMRTFHSGGAVKIITVNILDIITRNYNEKDSDVIKQLFIQEGNDLISKVSGSLTLKKSEYLDSKRDIKKKNDIHHLEYGYFYLSLNDKKYDITLDTKTDVYNADKSIETDETITWNFVSGEKLLTCPPTTDDFGNKVRIIESLLSGKKPYRNGDHFCSKIYDQYHSITGCDLVHFEVMASHLLRDKSNLSYPARLNDNYNPAVVSLKKIPSLESWLSALSFENPSEAISNGLIYERDKNESILEKIVNGNL